MNERLPYEKQLTLELNNLLLPDENLAWADMKRRLDEEDDDSTPVWWRRIGCLLSGLLLAGILGTAWLILKPGRWFNNEKQALSIEKPANSNQQGESTNYLSDSTNYRMSDKGTLSYTNRINDSDYLKEPPTDFEGNNLPLNKTGNNNSDSSSSKMLAKTKNGSISAAAENEKDSNKKNGQPDEDTPALSVSFKKDKQNQATMPVNRRDDSLHAEKNATTGLRDSVFVRGDENTKKYFTQKKIADTAVHNTIQNYGVSADDIKKKEEPKKSFTWYAGLSLHQQLPVAGQKMTPYSSAGRKSGIADYIPALYLRLSKDKKWFFQTEFRYGAPQYTKEFIFRQVSTPDTGTTPQFTTVKTSSLKKTFYHQLPLTFHYYIMPGWSLGAGLQWNKFGGAVYEQQDIKRNNFTQQDSLLSKKILSESSDSLYEFKKSYFQAVIETQYQWRKFSFGARYAFGLEPYIKFSLPGGVNQEERNNVVQVFLRYQLWKNNKNK